MEDNQEVGARNSDPTMGLIVVLFLIFAVIPRLYNCRLRYAIQYDTDTNLVFIDKEPSDCNFMTAPMGDKNCEYDKQIQVVKFSKDSKTAQPIISYDNGKSWQWDPNPLPHPTRPHIFVRWAKRSV